MIRFFAMLACICLLLQLVIKQAYDGGTLQPSQYVIVGLAYVAPLFPLIALARKPRRGLLSGVIERRRVEEAVRLAKARAELESLQSRQQAS